VQDLPHRQAPQITRMPGDSPPHPRLTEGGADANKDGVTQFTPVSALLGGVLIGTSVALLWAFTGRTAGISGIVGDAWLAPREGGGWRLWFLGGLAAGGFLWARLFPERFAWGAPRAAVTLVVAGLLVGFGTRLGNGCTSGHGLCGISRLSVRSIVATVVFMALGMTSVFLARRWMGAA
jgi:uncharacterized membrane protein YedE/YeeE